jgi:hypothetical protein
VADGPHRRRRPSVLGYVAAVLLFLAGVIGGITLIVVGVQSYVDRIEGFERFSVPGSTRVELDEGGHSIYFERPGLDDVDPIPRLSATVTPADGGAPLPLDDYDTDVSYQVSGHDGRGVFTFPVDDPGTYVVRADGSGGELAVGRGVGSRWVGSVIAGVALIGLGPLLGLVLAVVTFLRRSRAKRGAAPPPWAPTGWR